MDRRTYLRTAVGTTAIAALAKSASASENDIEVIEVPAGELRTIRVNDGETFENTLIDITNNRAAVRFIVSTDSASRTVIRNVGVRGQFHHNDYSGNAIVVRARHPDGEIIFDNFYWGDGCESNPEPHHDPSGVSVRPAHAGRVVFNRINLQGFPDNALYGSPAGHHGDHPSGPAQGGRVDVYNSYFANNMTSDIRLGTDSEIVNCGLYGNPHRGIWANQHASDEGQYVRNCHIQSGGSRAIAVGNNNWRGGRYNWVELEEDVYVDEGGLYTYNSGNSIIGEPAGRPEKHDPGYFDAPASAEEAVSGSAEFPGDPGEQPGDTSPPEGDFTLELTSDVPVSEYLFELDAATVEPGDNANTHDHEYQDRAFEHEGRWYVHGYVSDGGGDDYHVEDGEILRAGALEGSPRLRVGRRQLDVEAFDSIETVPDSDDPEPSLPEGDFTLELTSDEPVSEYLFELDAATVEPGAGANTHDHEYQDRAFEHEGRWYVHGYVSDGGGDDFHVEDGKILRAGALEGSPILRVESEELEFAAFDSIETVPDPDEEDAFQPEGDFTLELTSDAPVSEYLFELDAATVEPGDNANTHDHEYQDRAFEHEGRWYIHGYVSDGGGDDYHVEDGEILRVGALRGSPRVRVGERELGVEAFDSIETVPTSNDEYRTLEVAGQFEYRIEVSGEIQPAAQHAQWLTEGRQYGDDWAEWWLSGADTARTVWEFTGELTSLEIDERDGEVDIRTLTVDGEDIDPRDYR